MLFFGLLNLSGIPREKSWNSIFVKQHTVSDIRKDYNIVPTPYPYSVYINFQWMQ